MHALDQISQIGERMLKVNEAVGEVSNAQHGSNQFSMGSNISFCKSVPSETCDSLNRQRRNRFLQREGLP
jgi:hypothetical protein